MCVGHGKAKTESIQDNRPIDSCALMLRTRRIPQTRMS